ncbi:organic cation transporter 1-like [Oratosquilla oratoria]|uniref:organic cation transporter 1-like n=1 Tax=Oratosquilla oratoria TaxID=337810 RepID=UPI003F77720F
MDFDDILKEVGGFGKYQKWKIATALIPISFYTALQNNLLVFQMVVPSYWCHVPGRESTDLTVDQWKNLTLPPSLDVNGSFAKCHQYNISVTDGIVEVDPMKLSCQSGYDYDRTSYAETLSTYYGWLCDKEAYASHSFTVNVAGNAVGTVLLPYIADKFVGRRAIFFVAIGIALFFNLVLMVAPTYTLHLVCRFCAGLAFQSNWQMPYVIVVELIDPERRPLTSFLAFVSWTMGMCCTALLTWLLPHWIHFTLVATVPGALFFLLWRSLPESPRWLLTMERYNECIDVIQQIAKTNGETVPSKNEVMVKLKSLSKTAEKEETIMDIFSYTNICLNLLIVIIQGSCIYIVYGCLLLNINILPQNQSLNYFVLSLFELPSNVVGWLTTHYLGRRAAIHTSFLLSTICSLMAAMNTRNKWVLLSLAAFIKLFITKAIYVLFLYCAELFPTPVRSIIIGIVVVFGLISMSAAPYIDTAAHGVTFQYWVMMILSLVGFLVCLPLPETVGLPLPQTFEEANNLGKGRPLTRWIHHWNYNRYTEVPTSGEGSEKNEREEDTTRLDEIMK